MTKSKLKTTQTEKSVNAFIAAIEHEKRRADAIELLRIFNQVTGLKPKMWGGSMIGYGRYRYRYESGREGEYFMTGFSPRKANCTIYIMPGYQDLSSMLERLGKHKTGKSCLYINKLSDIDCDVLVEIIEFGLGYMRSHYETFDV